MSNPSRVRLIDLSLAVEPASGEPNPVMIDYVSHTEGGDLLGEPIGIDHRHFPGQMGLSLEHVRLTTHTGTHVDAPLHYGPRTASRAARAIDEMPLTWFYGRGVVLRCPGDRQAGPVTEEEIAAELDRIDYRLRPHDIVLVATGADRLWGTPEYFTNFRGMTREATSWFINRGVKVIGIDSFGFDAPFDAMLEAYEHTRNPAQLWPAHMVGREKEYCQIERLANLSAIGVPFGFRIACFPIKMRACGAAWSRVVAIVDETSP